MRKVDFFDVKDDPRGFIVFFHDHIIQMSYITDNVVELDMLYNEDIYQIAKACKYARVRKDKANSKMRVVIRLDND